MIKAYKKGYRKENKLVNLEKQQGRIALRSAGSHSPIDVISIDVKQKRVRFFQCKPDDFPFSQKLKLEREQKELNNLFACSFEVI